MPDGRPSGRTRTGATSGISKKAYAETTSAYAFSLVRTGVRSFLGDDDAIPEDLLIHGVYDELVQG